ncbi:Muramoyltetrapeptide carboxypeptidase LdcA (peptidoglycan recycling) [Paraoerskovia marina]|uniref:Muramoyltetrapeptide carboxypeptidase LdcA (Peptidoglycan recycling) n=1 Tax=Paraoerskovia marina TaxID=545619 RepID=A0A1H1MAA8_9CELL|nr:S66 peptidase family protein [Paraoerskovia marina]SDR83305.1 Muramoyltetrapeptide carboxypeptidase LdcA (peptidoglycan recycling) [Paraoerskovia marina]
MIRYPRPLAPGDTVGVTSPSAGVPDELSARLAVAVTAVEDRGFTVRVGDLMDGSGLTSGTADARGEELTALMTNGDVRAVVPPWGGATAIDLLPRLDWDALAADPTWLVGYSDVSTILLPLTLRTGVATLYGQNLMDTPYRVPSPLLSWLDVATAPAGSVLTQGSAPFHRLSGFDDYATHPAVAEYTLETPGGWRRLDGSGEVDVEGRLVGGCLETVSPLTGTPFGDVSAFAEQHAPEGLVVYLESSRSDASDVSRMLLGLRYAGWFDHANAVLLGTTRGEELPDLTHDDAARHALGDLGIPLIGGVDCGHVPPHLALVNGSLARVVHSSERSTIEQRLV